MICVLGKGGGRGLFSAGETLRPKSFRWEKAWQVPESARRPVWLEQSTFREASTGRVEMRLGRSCRALLVMFRNMD